MYYSLWQPFTYTIIKNFTGNGGITLVDLAFQLSMTGSHVLILVLTVVVATSMSGQVMVLAKEMGSVDMEKMVGQVLEQYTGCHLVLLTTAPFSPVASKIIRSVQSSLLYNTYHNVQSRLIVSDQSVMGYRW